MEDYAFSRRRLLQFAALLAGSVAYSDVLKKSSSESNLGIFTASTYDSKYKQNAIHKTKVNKTKSTIFKYNLDQDSFISVENSVSGHCIEPLKKNKNLALAVEKFGRHAALIDWSVQKEILRISCQDDFFFNGHCTFNESENIAFISGYQNPHIGFIFICDLSSGKIIEKISLKDKGDAHDIITLKPGYHVAAINGTQPYFIRFNDSGEFHPVKNEKVVKDLLVTHLLRLDSERLIAIANRLNYNLTTTQQPSLFTFNSTETKYHSLELNSYSWNTGELLSLALDGFNRLWVTEPDQNKVSVINLPALKLEAEIKIENPTSTHLSVDGKHMIVGSNNHFKIYGCLDQKNALSLLRQTRPMINHGSFSTHSRLI
jgi:hypothetical protein